MTPEIKEQLISELKTNVIGMCKDYITILTRNIDIFASQDNHALFADMLEDMHKEAEKKASTPFQRFIVSYISMKKTAMNTVCTLINKHQEWEKEEMQTQKYIDQLQEFFLKRCEEIKNRSAQS
jgi:hypothetical protein